MGFAAARLLNMSTGISPEKVTFPNPFMGIEVKRAKVELS
jgi:hypothetical protein